MIYLNLYIKTAKPERYIYIWGGGVGGMSCIFLVICTFVKLRRTQTPVDQYSYGDAM